MNCDEVIDVLKSDVYNIVLIVVPKYMPVTVYDMFISNIIYTQYIYNTDR